MKKILAILLVACMAVTLLVACGNGDESGTPTTSGSQSPGTSPTGSGEIVSAKDTLRIAIGGDNGTLIPANITGGFVGVVRQYQEVLVDFMNDGTMVYILATDVEELEDKWVVTLREGVTFSNGNPFTAQDVLFTLEWYFTQPMGPMYLSTIDMETTRIIDDHKIEIGLLQYSLTQLSSMSQIYILDHRTFDENESVMNPIGTGPYFVTDYVINSHLYMKARDDWWGGTPHIENLQFRILTEDAQFVNAIQAGTVDVATVPGQDVDFVKGLPGLNVNQWYGGFVPILAFNFTDGSLMSSMDARVAVAHAFNRDAVINLAYFGSASQVDQPFSAGSRDMEARFANMHPVYSVGYDVDLAKEYAERAGLVGQELVVITNGTSANVATAEILQDNLRAIGITLIINNYDVASFSAIANDPTMFDLQITAVASPHNLGFSIVDSYVSWGEARYASGWPRWDDYIALGRTALSNRDAASRGNQLYEMLQMFTEVMPWYGIADIMNSMAISSDIAGNQVWSAGGSRYFEWYFTG